MDAGFGTASKFVIKKIHRPGSQTQDPHYFPRVPKSGEKMSSATTRHKDPHAMGAVVGKWLYCVLIEQDFRILFLLIFGMGRVS